MGVLCTQLLSDHAPHMHLVGRPSNGMITLHPIQPHLTVAMAHNGLHPERIGILCG